MSKTSTPAHHAIEEVKITRLLPDAYVVRLMDMPGWHILPVRIAAAEVNMQQIKPYLRTPSSLQSVGPVAIQSLILAGYPVAQSLQDKCDHMTAALLVG